MEIASSTCCLEAGCLSGPFCSGLSWRSGDYLMSIFIHHGSRIARCENFDKDIEFLQKCLQSPSTVDHFATLLEPTDRPSMFRCLQACGNLEVLVEVGQVVTKPSLIRNRNSVTVAKLMRGNQDPGWDSRLRIADHRLEAEIHLKASG